MQFTPRAAFDDSHIHGGAWLGARARLALQARTLDWKRTEQAVFLAAKTTWEWTAAGLLLCCWYLIPLCPTTQR
jgi:hypothetical protein